MASNEKLLPCPFCGSDEVMDFRAHLENRIQCAECNVSTEYYPSHEESHEAWNARAAQPVAVDGMPGRMAKPDQWADEYDRGEIKGHNACRGDFTAWLSKAAMGLPERPYASDEQQAQMTEYEIGLGHGGCEMWDAVTPLVAQLRAENSELRKFCEDAAKHYEKERDALRAENKKLLGGCADLSSQVREIEHKMDYWKGLKEQNDTLRTAHVELTGLLRKIKVRVDACLEDEANMGPGSMEFLQGEIDALLASTGGGDAQV